MKRNLLLLTGALSLSLISLADAATTNYVYMSGSTAGRSAVYATLASSSAVFDAAPGIVTQGNATPSKATYMSFFGTIGGTNYAVKCFWSGSEGGIADIAGTGTQQFLDDSAATSSSSPGPFVPQQVDLAMADNDKAYSKNPSAPITGTKIAVIPFMLLKEKGSKAALTNVTAPQFRQALTGGAKLVLFTGNSADTSFVYVSGRDDNSGTRVNTLGCTGYGIFKNAYQVTLNGSGNMLDPNGDLSYLTSDGKSGYSGGGSLATQLGVDCSSTTDMINGGTGISVIGYVGVSDANTAIGLGASQVSFNGVLSTPTTVIEGQYSIWGNYYGYRRNSATPQATTVYNKLVASTGVSANADGSTLISLSSMHATRNGPTTDPIHN